MVRAAMQIDRSKGIDDGVHPTSMIVEVPPRISSTNLSCEIAVRIAWSGSRQTTERHSKSVYFLCEPSNHIVVGVSGDGIGSLCKGKDICDDGSRPSDMTLGEMKFSDMARPSILIGGK